MQNRPVCFFHVWKARRTRFLSFAWLAFVPGICIAQEPSLTPSPSEMEAEPVVVTATRFDIPLDLSPASASVITSEDLEQKQIERVSDALREVPGSPLFKPERPAS
jgi:outer membrane receptor for ferrienterochelin and colicin